MYKFVLLNLLQFNIVLFLILVYFCTYYYVSVYLYISVKKKCSTIYLDIILSIFVRLIGLEPTRRETPDPKSGASTNSATSASRVYRNRRFFHLCGGVLRSL